MKAILLFLAVIIIGLVSCNHDSIDYNEKYFGDYDFTAYTYSLINEGQHGVTQSYDTIRKSGKIEKFNGSIYYDDVSHKISVSFGNYNEGVSTCNGARYSLFPDVIHPTLSTKGQLTYPEFTCGAQDSFFSGSFSGDSVKILYGINYNDEMWNVRILGQKK